MAVTPDQFFSRLPPSLKAGTFARHAGESQHPSLWRGLLFAFCPSITGGEGDENDTSAFKDLSPYRQRVLNSASGISWLTEEEGRVVNFDGSGFLEFDTPASVNASITDQLTFFSRWKTNETQSGSTGRLVGRSNGSGSDDFVFGLDDFGGGNSVIWTRVYTSTDKDFSIFTTVALDSWNSTICTYDGSLITTTSTHSGGLISSSLAQTGNVRNGGEGFIVGGHATSSTRRYDGLVGGEFIWNRVLTQHEQDLMFQDACAPFRKRERRLVVVAGPPTILTSDGITFTDLLGLIGAHATTLQDTVALADLLTLLKSVTTVIAEGSNFGDTVTIAGVRTFSLTDAAALGDLFTLVAVRAFSQSDGVALADALTPTGQHGLSITDGAAFADALALATSRVLAQSESVVLGDTLVLSQTGQQIILSDGLTLGEVLTLATSRGLAQADAFVLGDALTLSQGDKQINLSEALALADALALLSGHNLTLADVATLTDLFSYFSVRSDIGSYGVTLSDSITLSQGAPSTPLTSRHTGLNRVIHFMGPGEEYTSVAAFEADYDVDTTATGLAQTHELHIRAAGAPYPDTVTFDTGVHDVDYPLVIRAAAGDENRWRRDAGVRFEISSANNAWVISDDYIYIHDIGFKYTFNSVGIRTGIFVNNDGVLITNCFFYDGTNTLAEDLFRVIQCNTSQVDILNVVMANNEGEGIVNSNSTLRCYNSNIIQQGTNGISAFSGSSLCKNVIVSGGTTNFNSTAYHVNSTHNISSDGTAPGSSPQTFVAPLFVGGGDFHLSPSDTIAKSKGASLLSDPDGLSFDDDVDGQLRTVLWDAGGDHISDPLRTIALADGVTLADLLTLIATRNLTTSDVVELGDLILLSGSRQLSTTDGAVFSDSLSLFQFVAPTPLTSRRTGLNRVIHFMGPGEEYTSVAAFEADYDVDTTATGLAQTHELHIRAIGAPYPDMPVFNGGIHDVDYPLVIKAARGDENRWTTDSGVRFEFTTSTNGWTLQDPYIYVHDIGFKSTFNIAAIRIVMNIIADGVLVSNCNFYDGTNSASANLYRVAQVNNSSADFLNVLMSNNEGEGLVSNNGTIRAYNSTIANQGTQGVSAFTGSVLCKNVIISGSGNNDFNSVAYHVNSTHNISSDSTAPGSNPQTLVTPLYIGGGDFHLAVSDTIAAQKGVALASDPDGLAFDDDIDGEGRTIFWDAGGDHISDPLRGVDFTDGLNLGDLLAMVHAGNLNVADEALLSEFIVYASIRAMALSDGLTFGDATAFIASRVFNFADGLTFSDTVPIFLRNSPLPIAESAVFTDVLSLAASRSLALSDGLTLSDVMNISQDLGIGYVTGELTTSGRYRAALVTSARYLGELVTRGT